jgi:hypothetical protein
MWRGYQRERLAAFSEEGKIKKLQLTSKPRRCNLETLSE